MWAVNGKNLSMAECDYGIILPVTVKGTTLTENDSLKFVFKSIPNGTVVLEKEFTNIQENTVDFTFDKEESVLFSAGASYVYSLDWYQDGVFMCNLIPKGILKVVDKA